MLQIDRNSGFQLFLSTIIILILQEVCTGEKKLKNQIKNERTWYCRYLRK